ncbi:MAG: zinc ribbon domain-containing protein [Thermoanaerobaculum sp.]|nr:zinc ribbon domain-containing protein [Thermoanaerobaculum sp.]
MPLYEYRCEACGHRFELLQRMGAGSQGVKCPACGSEAVKRLLSTFASMQSGAAPCGASPSSCSSGFS